MQRKLGKIKTYTPLFIGIAAYLILKFYLYMTEQAACTVQPCPSSHPLHIQALPYIFFLIGAVITGILLFLNSRKK